MKPEIIVILAIFIGFILLEILFTQFFRKEKQVKGDGWVDLLSTLMLTGVTQPAVLFMGAFLATLIVPIQICAGTVIFIILNGWRLSCGSWNAQSRHPPHIVRITENTPLTVSPITKAITAISYSSGIYYSERRKSPANIQKNSASKTCLTQASQNNSSGRSSRRNNPN